MGTIAVVSDFCDGQPVASRFGEADFDRAGPSPQDAPPPGTRAVAVDGGYLERLPLAAVSAGLAETAEIWSFSGRDDADAFDSAPALHGFAPPSPCPAMPRRRVFRAAAHAAPYGSADALAHIRYHGAPSILCVWGLGVDEALMSACADSLKIYNSIDADAIRIPPEVSRHFDLFLTGASWQSDVIRARHPGAACAVLPVGPDFASDTTFYPTGHRAAGAEKDRDVVYVAATQPYKRHDLLLDTAARLPGLRVLCVVGYGHMTDDLRREAEARGLDIEWVGPLDHAGVNRQIARARVGVVCGRDDGAPAILTEYMLAGLPVLANADLCCGLQYIRPDTGIIASEADFAPALAALLDRAETYDTRSVVQANWTWPHSIRRFAALLDDAAARRRLRRPA